MPHHEIYKRGVRAENNVALTFDDGPNPPRTEQILAILAAYGVHASFFIMGRWAERFPRTVERTLAAGHVVGNHGYAGQGRIGDYDAAEAIIGHLTGRPSRYLRPHTLNYGAYFQSIVANLPESLAIDIEIDSSDWRTTPGGAPLLSADEIVHNVLESPHLGPGSIILFHDGAEWDDPAVRLQRPLPTIAALPRILDGLVARGLTPVALDRLTLDAPSHWSPSEG